MFNKLLHKLIIIMCELFLMFAIFQLTVCQLAIEDDDPLPKEVGEFYNAYIIVLNIVILRK